MACLKLWLCLALLLLSLSPSQTLSIPQLSRKLKQTLTGTSGQEGVMQTQSQFSQLGGFPKPAPFPPRKAKRALIANAQEMFKARRRVVLDNQYEESKRVSPGGPDPKHH